MFVKSSAIARKANPSTGIRPAHLRSTRPDSLKYLQPRAGFTILELLTVVAVIAIVLGVTLPAISSAREAARKVQCVNRLKQIGIALHNYHDVYRSLPAGWQWERTEQSAYGWGVALLPYLEQPAIYRRIDRNRLIDDPANTFVSQTSLSAFLCPSDIYDKNFTLFRDDGDEEDELTTAPIEPLIPLVDLPTANYIAVFGTIEPDDDIPIPEGDGAFPGARCNRFSVFTRGLSNTLFIGERTMGRVPSTWLGVDSLGEDATCRLVGSAIDGPNCAACDECEFDSRHPGGANFLWGDGHVKFISETVDSKTYQTMSRLYAPIP
jgi:prepilin-type processing-associated H-X9-DG protein/prepilin-type N-terminal cleavage/methylation domain-containing protein